MAEEEKETWSWNEEVQRKRLAKKSGMVRERQEYWEIRCTAKKKSYTEKGVYRLAETEMKRMHSGLKLSLERRK